MADQPASRVLVNDPEEVAPGAVLPKGTQVWVAAVIDDFVYGDSKVGIATGDARCMQSFYVRTRDIRLRREEVPADGSDPVPPYSLTETLTRVIGSDPPALAPWDFRAKPSS